MSGGDMFISVIMPAYNADVFLEEAIDSVLGQTHADFELILANDGSTDSTLDIMQRRAAVDQRVRVLTHDNWGVANTLNHAMKSAHSDWVAIMHADDIMEPRRLERQIHFVQQHENLAVASCLVTYINDSGKVLGKSSSELTTEESVRRYVEQGEIIGFHHPGVIMRKSVAEATGGYRQEFWPAEDIDLWNRITENNHAILVQPEYLLKYRVHGAAASISYALKARTQMDWIKHCAHARRQQLPELTYEEYLGFLSELPWYVRLNKARKNIAKVSYKKATFSYSSHSIGRMLLALTCSLLLQPSYCSRQVWTKFVRMRLGI